MQKEKNTSKIIIFIGLLTLLIGCTTQSEPLTPDVAISEENTGTEEQVLNFYNWDTYIDPDILTDFEEKFDVKINYEIFDDEEEMLANLQSGDTVYDLVVPSGFTVSEMRQENMLAPLNKENIPNFVNLDSAFVNPVHDPGNRYCAPYQWGTVGIGYNIKATGPIENWDDVFDPVHAGRVGLIDDPRSTMEMILLFLGYSPNTTNKEEIDEAAQFLIDRADIIATYHGDDGQDLLNEGELDIVLEWSGDIFQIMEENPDIRYLIPPEGSIVWTDYMCIPVNAEHKELAEKLINYLLDPEVGAALSTYIQYGSPNQAAIPLLAESDRNNEAIYPPDEVRARLFPEIQVDAAASAYYDQVWQDVLSSVEQ